MAASAAETFTPMCESLRPVVDEAVFVLPPTVARLESHRIVSMPCGLKSFGEQVAQLANGLNLNDRTNFLQFDAKVASIDVNNVRIVRSRGQFPPHFA